MAPPRKRFVPKFNSREKTAFKLGLTLLALWLVFRQVDWEQFSQIISRAQGWWILVAWLLFVFSKVASAQRLWIFYRSLPLWISRALNLKLYWVGMYYNLFLPGGVGGDGYKVYWLQKYSAQRTKTILTATLIDRLSGLVALGVGLLLLAPFSSVVNWLGEWAAWIWVGAGLIYFFWFLIINQWFHSFTFHLILTNTLSLAVQGFQLLTVVALLQALGISDAYADYLLIFLLSSLAALLPITIGGVGAREAVFFFVPVYLGSPINQQQALAVSLLFFILTALTSLAGATVKLPPHLPKQANDLINPHRLSN